MHGTIIPGTVLLGIIGPTFYLGHANLRFKMNGQVSPAPLSLMHLQAHCWELEHTCPSLVLSILLSIASSASVHRIYSIQKSM
jgi:hypothetical protein